MARVREMTKKKSSADDAPRMCGRNLDEITRSLNGKKSVNGIDRVLKLIKTAQDPEDKLDFMCQLIIGKYFSDVAEVEFEKLLSNTSPHDIVLTFDHVQIVVEVKRIRTTGRHYETVEDLLESNDFIEIEDQGELGKLILNIKNNKYKQLERDYSNIIFIVSKDLFFDATKVQDAATEIIRLKSTFYCKEYQGSQYEKLHALFHMNEDTCDVESCPVFEDEHVQALREALNPS